MYSTSGAMHDSGRGTEERTGSGTTLPASRDRPGNITLPHLLHLVAAFFGIDMDGLNSVTELHREAEAFLGDAGPAMMRNDDRWLDQACRV